MAVSGVRNSCETLATKSLRTRSSRSRSVMSCRMAMAPLLDAPASGAACTSKERRPRRSNACAASTTRPRPPPCAAFRRKSGSRTRRSTGKPAGTGPWPPNAPANAALQNVTRSSLSTASTPSTMPVRMASRRAPSNRTLSTSSLTCAATRPNASARLPTSSADSGCGGGIDPVTSPSTKIRSRPMRPRRRREKRNA